MKQISGFQHIKNKPDNCLKWSTRIINKKIDIDDSVFKLFDKEINGKIVEKQECLLIHFFNADDEKHIMNLECYAIEWHEKSESPMIQRFMYIPKTDIDNFMRMKKLERILEDDE